MAPSSYCPYGGGVFKTPTGRVAIPTETSADAYANNVRCDFVITTGRTIHLRFDSFRTELPFDYVEVYDGNSDLGTLLGVFSGLGAPANASETNASGTIASWMPPDMPAPTSGMPPEIPLFMSKWPPAVPPATSGTMFIRFVSNGDVAESGVVMSWSEAMLPPTTAAAGLRWVLGTSGANACQDSRGPTDAECAGAVDVALKAIGRVPGRGVLRGVGSGMYA